MKADILLSRLEKVRRTGDRNWVACCPSHADKNPSMTVRELKDETVLLHCFAGCPVESILGAVGLDFDALFPEKPMADRMPPMRRPFPAADVLECLSKEATVVMVALATVNRGESLPDNDKARLKVAYARIQEGRDLALGG